MHNLEFLIPITFFASVAFILFKLYDDRHRERMSIIEKGLVKEDVKFLYSHNYTWKVNPMSSLKWGMLAAFIGLGILVSTAVSMQFPMIEDQLTAGFIFLFGGIGLILFYAMASKKIESADPV